jgi:hypothetical protein
MISRAAEITLDRFEQAFVVTPDQKLRFAAVKPYTDSAGYVTSAFMQQPQTAAAKTKEKQPGKVLSFLFKGLMGQAPFSRELLTVNRLEYVHKRPLSRPTIKKYNGFMNQHAVANSLQEHSLRTVNGLVTVTAPAEAAQLQSLAATSASPMQQSSEPFRSAPAPGILMPSCETSAL